MGTICLGSPRRASTRSHGRHASINWPSADRLPSCARASRRSSDRAAGVSAPSVPLDAECVTGSADTRELSAVDGSRSKSLRGGSACPLAACPCSSPTVDRSALRLVASSPVAHTHCFRRGVDRKKKNACNVTKPIRGELASQSPISGPESPACCKRDRTADWGPSRAAQILAGAHRPLAWKLKGTIEGMNAP